MEGVPVMDAPIDMTMLEALVIYGHGITGTAGGESNVDLSDSNLLNDDVCASTLDKENKSAQRAGAEARSSVLDAILFGAQPPNPPLGAGTHSLFGGTASSRVTVLLLLPPPALLCVLHTATRAAFLRRRGHGAPSPRLMGAGDNLLGVSSW